MCLMCHLSFVCFVALLLLFFCTFYLSLSQHLIPLITSVFVLHIFSSTSTLIFVVYTFLFIYSYFLFTSLFIWTYFCLNAAAPPEFPLWGSIKAYLILSFSLIPLV